MVGSGGVGVGCGNEVEGGGMWGDVARGDGRAGAVLGLGGGMWGRVSVGDGMVFFKSRVCAHCALDLVACFFMRSDARWWVEFWEGMPSSYLSGWGLCDSCLLPCCRVLYIP